MVLIKKPHNDCEVFLSEFNISFFSNGLVPIVHHRNHDVSNGLVSKPSPDVVEEPNGRRYKHKHHHGVPILHLSKHVAGLELLFLQLPVELALS
jgi:hypothetical protein